MFDDQKMDALLRRTMPAPPELSSSFNQNVMRQVKPRRLTSTGRVLMASYTLVSLAVLAWLFRDLPAPLILGSLFASGLVAGGTGLYAAHLLRRLHSHPAP